MRKWRAGVQKWRALAWLARGWRTQGDDMCPDPSSIEELLVAASLTSILCGAAAPRRYQDGVLFTCCEARTANEDKVEQVCIGAG